MVRTQLYLPDELYGSLKENAKAKKMSFAQYVRLYLEKEVTPKEHKKSLYEAFPFLKYAGMIHAGADASNNDEIDKAIYDL